MTRSRSTGNSIAEPLDAGSVTNAYIQAVSELGSGLSHSHAFDEGHSDRMKWIEGERHSLLSELDRRREFYPSYFVPEPLQELISTESVPIQAADIAASLAREIWKRNSLVQLVRRFEYVTYNGGRLSEIRAAMHEINLRELLWAL